MALIVVGTIKEYSLSDAFPELGAAPVTLS